MCNELTALQFSHARRMHRAARQKKKLCSVSRPSVDASTRRYGNIRRKRGIRPFSMRLVCKLIIVLFSVNGVIVLKNSPHTLPYVAIDKRWLLFSHIENQGLNNFPFPTNQST